MYRSGENDITNQKKEKRGVGAYTSQTNSSQAAHQSFTISYDNRVGLNVR